MTTSNPQLIAYYLPQFHRIKFNDDYWGRGFTEWTNTAKAKPLFKGHYQPHVPAHLGFYDLTVPSSRIEQAQLAKEYGVDGFCYWHYWFGKGRKVMERPFEEVVKSGEPDFSFCLAWANHDWHDLRTKEVTIPQCYEGIDDYTAHFYDLLDAFRDKRYIRIDDKPVFVIYDPFASEEIIKFMAVWRELAAKNGLTDFYFIALTLNDTDTDRALQMGYDGVNVYRLSAFLTERPKYKQYCDYLLHKITHKCNVYKYAEALKHFTGDKEMSERVFPTIVTGWDHSPRSGKYALILDQYTPATFEQHLDRVYDTMSRKSNRVAFIRSWNEWAEGNHLEPDLRYGLGYLEKLKAFKDKL